ncbi:gliding motility-associated C-terminal domain-containing protein [Mucilaginibacter sp. KACC 22063]|uniref:gliding motility-associated C-terminal domain-containing protein n=1 Tax=Mucilaginibacter sp. KACC 22063 TaxID=3025666 RepID=UPI00236721AB|nr:gliding motility-associated C-terminal domain-containing protein [Mucilaginibacter sp. KACC 22063]WDF55488.1 gliding motility-associated C-terminal domain-containing protein [Mucilaginibacter sp. KACC 22063]
MRPLLKSFYSLLIILFTACHCFGQGPATCNGSLGKPVVNETFGAGAGPGAPLGAAITNMNYTASNCNVQDSYYTITNRIDNSCIRTWFTATDRTGDANGYFMLINASYAPSVFYTKRVSGGLLCASTMYEFKAYIMNILSKTFSNGAIEPNITLSIEKTDGTILASVNTGSIPSEDLPTWNPYSVMFQSPADGSDVIIKMTNNAAGGNGNDLALDDITFSPCGPLIQTGFASATDNANQNRCKGQDLIYTLHGAQTGYVGPVYRWQQKAPGDADWSDVAGQTSNEAKINVPNAAVGVYQYRMGVINAAQVGSESCWIYSDSLIINVYGPSQNAVQANTAVCTGNALQLNATDGDTYQWTDPQGNSLPAGPNPTVTTNATHNNAGVYKVMVTKNGCPAFFSTTVTVYDQPVLASLSDQTICQGSSVQLNAQAQNVNHYKWVPSTGLDHDDIANPVASPAVTTSYTLTVYNDGCPDTKLTTTVNVNVLKLPKADAGTDIKMFEGSTATISGSAQGDQVSYYWTPTDFLDDPSSLTPQTSATSDITYTLHVVSSLCGESDDQVFVRVFKKLDIPNAFSPNGDGINDLWQIKNLSTYPQALISVYSRYGQKVFESRGYSVPWNGTYNSALLPAGTYYYVFDLGDPEVPKKSGWVLLVR